MQTQKRGFTLIELLVVIHLVCKRGLVLGAFRDKSIGDMKSGRNAL